MSDITPSLGTFYEAAGYIGIAYIQMLVGSSLGRTLTYVNHRVFLILKQEW